MFSGIVETIGRVASRNRNCLTVEPGKNLKGLAIGESVCVDGVCLTVEEVRTAGVAQRISFQLLPETLRVSTVSQLQSGDQVNLERSLKVGDRLGGHLLLGHVGGQGTIVGRVKRGSSLTLEVRLASASDMHPFLVPKGPIGMDGVSLTIDPHLPEGPCADFRIRVHLIPYTIHNTALGRKRVGNRVNLELDTIAKYLFRML